MSDDSTTASVHEPRSGAANSARGPRSPWGSTMTVLVIVVVLLIAGATLVGVALGRSATSAKATITVTGSGTVQGTPDTVSFQIGVLTTAKSAVAALSTNNARVGSLETALRTNGVAKKDMQTSGLNIYENTNSSGQVTGFSVSDNLNVTMHDIKKAGAAIDAAAQAAGNGIQLYGVTFSISNQSKLLASARAKAMHNARTEASQVASGGGASLGSIVRITDQENSSTSPVYPFAGATNTKSSGVPIQAGSQTITVQVSVVYALKG